MKVYTLTYQPMPYDGKFANTYGKAVSVGVYKHLVDVYDAIENWGNYTFEATYKEDWKWVSAYDGNDDNTATMECIDEVSGEMFGKFYVNTYIL